MLVDRKEAKRSAKQKNLVEMQRQKKADLSDDEKLDNQDLLGAKTQEDSENDDDLEEERQIRQMAKEQIRNKR
jgi:hypothetical protein